MVARGTHRQISSTNRPDIVIKNKEEITCTLIDVAVDPRKEILYDRTQKKTKIQEFVYRNTSNVGH
jgi:hypothetical protein